MNKIVDTHVHLFDLKEFRYPWLNDFPKLKKNFLLADYFETIKNFNLSSVIFIEANVQKSQAKKEIFYLTNICKKSKIPMGIICYADIFSNNFKNSINEIVKNPFIKGIRYVLHTDNISRKTCLKEEFINNIKYLGKKGLIFEICAKTNELEDIYSLVKKCPETSFVLNHMGNIDPNLFTKKNPESISTIRLWEKDMKKLASLKNLFCKISGMYLSKFVSKNTCKEIVTFCLKNFHENKLIIGSNYPVSQEFFKIDLWFNFLNDLLDDYPISFKENLLYRNSHNLYFKN